MSIYYSKRQQPLGTVYEKIENTCKKHIAIASYDSGDLESFSNESMLFPAAYLETINQVEETGNSEIYSVSLNLLDRQVKDGTREQQIQVHDKLKQIFAEIKLYLGQKQVFGSVNVGNASILLFTDFDDASLVRLRADFTVTVQALDTPVADLAIIFSR